jgi:YesN/AraC family two-component response regulator
MAKIMIVDDSTVMRMNLRKILINAGHHIVAEAQNGKDACLYYEKLRPDLITMDISMPLMSGVEATRVIMERFPDANIIMISALTQKNMVYEALRNGARHYIIKPIDSDKVLRVVNEVLNEPTLASRKENESPSETNNGFVVENINGIFFFRFYKSLTIEKLDEVEIVLNGIRYVSPLVVRFDFGDMSSMEQNLLDRILIYAKEIINLGGDYESIAGNSTFKRLIDSLETRRLS